MSFFIEAIFEGGVLRPLTTYHLKEHKHYRLMLMDEVPTTELCATNTMRDNIAQRTTHLPDGRCIINALGIVSSQVFSLDVLHIETLLNEFRTAQAAEWGDTPHHQDV